MIFRLLIICMKLVYWSLLNACLRWWSFFYWQFDVIYVILVWSLPLFVFHSAHTRAHAPSVFFSSLINPLHWSVVSLCHSANISACMCRRDSLMRNFFSFFWSLLLHKNLLSNTENVHTSVSFEGLHAVNRWKCWCGLVKKYLTGRQSVRVRKKYIPALECTQCS